MTPVLPNFLAMRQSNDSSNLQEAYTSDVSFRIGIVTAAIPPDDPRNQNQKSYEYDVECMVSDGQGNPTPQTYSSCILASWFGTPSDFTKWSLRAEKRNRERDQVDEPGSRVLVACPNGLSRAPMIMGAVPHPDSPNDDQADGYYWRFSFNGVTINVNNDGEYIIKRAGPTNSKGEPLNSGDKDKATTITMTKDGTMTIVMGDDGKMLELKEKGSNTVMMVGDGGKSAAVAEQLKQLYNQLVEQLKLITVPTGMGPSGTPVNAAAFPSWDSSIESAALKIPK